MAFQGLTPEALVDRTDSKNPATTCKGLTSSGRPCRRGIGCTPGGSPAPSPGNSPAKYVDTNGVVAILNQGDAAAFFCWQHKDQAENLVAKVRQERRKTKIMPLHERSSIDTLAEKVGVLDLDAEVNKPERNAKHGSGGDARRKKRRETLPQEWQNVQGPLMTLPEDVVHEAMATPTKPPHRRTTYKQERYGRSNVKASWSCCIRSDDDYNDDGPPARRRERHEQRPPSSQTQPQSNRPVSHGSRPTAVTQTQMQERPAATPHRHSQQLTPTRPPPRPAAHPSSPHTQTQNFLSLIPPHLNPNTTSALLSELSKPFAKDDEAGYIYIFWLTPASEDSTPDDDLASTILDGDLDYQDNFRASAYSDSRPRTTTARNRARALDRYASVKKHDREPPKILLKIGRAQNVHRRMTQWTKQCNQNITLVRYYPHYASAAADPRGPGGAKVPHVNKVERLVHLELRGLGMGKEAEKCADCGREHREWFEVPATRDGLRGVDGVVRRWVQWAENLPPDKVDAVDFADGGYY
ncbi:hypothetical protein PMZ80_006078 [Knufia obscura]|uniref:Bacteriophage T5 Orf172 DNA-binding domain-containing protein n=1 Tax=Knufia obscura TaxID=1635080 RepID=A0ABR0RPG2_9EURO|nr:hypothetical protein PMZ80_006078 [Knufia obscura]